MVANNEAEVYDQRCLLALQHVLSVKGIKIPWDEVGAKLGPTITEGAIVQHLAKLRTRLENDGVKVTPALQRGGRVRTSRAATDNNVKTVSAKGAVTKRTGSGTASNKKYSSIHDGKDDSKLDETSPRKGEAKAITATEKAENVSESIRAEIKTEPLSSGDSKNPGKQSRITNSLTVIQASSFVSSISMTLISLKVALICTRTTTMKKPSVAMILPSIHQGPRMITSRTLSPSVHPFLSSSQAVKHPQPLLPSTVPLVLW